MGTIARTHESDDASSSGELDEATASSQVDATPEADPGDSTAPVDESGDGIGPAGGGDAASAGSDAEAVTDGETANRPDARKPVERGEATGDASGDGEPLLCWVCRQPLDRAKSVSWRGEPVHPHCI